MTSRPEAPVDWLDQLLIDARRVRGEATERNPALGRARGAVIVALGLATVDAERAAAHWPADRWEPLARDPLLGASVRRRRPGSDAVPDILLLEPDSEGPIAASLARFGEGLAVVYLRAGERITARGRRSADGPLGPATLLSGPRWGPHVVALDPAATIAP